MSSSAQRRALLRASPIVFAIAAIAAHAEPAANKLDEVIVTATRTPQKLADVLADVTVLTRADIERQATGTLADVLRRQVGFEMIRNGGAGANTSMFVRGADTRHTAVLIDGVRIDSQASSGVSWNAIPLSQIERVEIVRGAASAIYGSDAIGGVVQIFTRKGEREPVVELAAGGGNRGLVKADASVSGGAGMFDYTIGISGESSNGFNTRPVAAPPAGFTPDDDGHVLRNASLRLGAQLNKAHRLELSALTSHVDAEYDATATSRINDRTVSDTKTRRAAWSAQWTDALHTDLSIGESSERYEIPPPGFAYITRTQVRTYALTGNYKLGAAGELHALAERREDRLENTGLTESGTPGFGKRHQNAIGGGWLWNVGAFSMQIHGRRDSDSEFGKADTGAFALGWKLTPSWRVQGSIGTSFRAPSLYQRYTEYGKPGLRPEKGRNAEIGLHYAQGRTEAGITAYRNDVHDLIIFSAPGPCRSEFGCYDNVSEGRLQGVSMRGATELAGIRWSGTLDMQAPKDRSTGTRLARRGQRHGVIRAETDIGQWLVGAELISSSNRIDNVTTRYKLGGYTAFGIDGQYAFSRQLSLQFKVENLTDKRYETARGYAVGPRQFFIGLRVTPQF